MRNVYRSDDPDNDFARWDEDRQRWLRSRPICHECLEPIQEEYGYKIGGEWLCPDCLEDLKVWIDE